MVRISRILKDFRETGALNSLIAGWGFVDDTTFLTKAGAVGVLYRLEGVDFECLDHPQRQAIAHRFEQALRQLDESFRVYQYVLKRPAPVVNAAAHPHPVVDEGLRQRTGHFAGKRDPLLDLELYLVVLYEGAVTRPSWSHRLGELVASPATAIRERLSVRTGTAVAGRQLARATAHLHHTA